MDRLASAWNLASGLSGPAALTTRRTASTKTRTTKTAKTTETGRTKVLLHLLELSLLFPREKFLQFPVGLILQLVQLLLLLVRQLQHIPNR